MGTGTRVPSSSPPLTVRLPPEMPPFYPPQELWGQDLGRGPLPSSHLTVTSQKKEDPASAAFRGKYSRVGQVCFAGDSVSAPW